MRTEKILGAGWAFAPRLDARGRIALARGESDVEEAIRIILLTSKGERAMRPSFGSDLFKLQFEPNDAATAGLARRLVMEALERWEPRIEVVEVFAQPDPDEDATLLIEVEYRLLATGEEFSLEIDFPLSSGD